MTDFAPAPVLPMANPRNGQSMSHGNDANLFAEFYVRAVPHNLRTEQEGRPIFIDQIFVKIYIPGDRNSAIDRKARDEDKVRFPRQWAAFELQKQQTVEGTPLDQWALLTPSQCAEYRALHIFTVEQLANLSDSQIQKIGHAGRDVNKMAKAYLERASKDAGAPAAAAEVSRLRDELAEKDATIRDLAARLDALEQDKPRRGRPPKE